MVEYEEVKLEYGIQEYEMNKNNEKQRIKDLSERLLKVSKRRLLELLDNIKYKLENLEKVAFKHDIVENYLSNKSKTDQAIKHSILERLSDVLKFLNR